MNYLQYLNNPTPKNVQAVHNLAGKTQVQMANIARIGLPTYKGWLAPATNTNHRTPPIPAWNLFLFELQARQLGFNDLQDFFKKIQNNA